MMTQASTIGIFGRVAGALALSVATAAPAVAGCDWPMFGRTPARAFSLDDPDCASIDAGNASTLVPAWIFKTPRTVTASPAVVDGTVYVGDWSGTMYALDLHTGDLVWKFRTPEAAGAAFGPIVSSAAVAPVEIGGTTKTLVVFGSGPRLFALDAADGQPVWVSYFGGEVPEPAPDASTNEPTEIESSPVFFGDAIYVGIDTHNRPDEATGGIRGGILAIEAATGAMRWKFEPEGGAGAGCGGVWSSPSIDVADEILYFGTANCPDADFAWTPHVEAVTALDISGETPVALWAFRPDGQAQNTNDWDFAASPNLFTVDVDGSPAKRLGIGKKDGAYYMFDLAPGGHGAPTLVWSRQIVEPGDTDEDSSIGGFIGTPAVFRGDVFGGTAIGGPPYLHGLDGGTGDDLWPLPGIAGPTYASSAVVNGVLFAGALDGVFRAIDIATGLPLWAMPLLGPVSSSAAAVGDTVVIGSGTSSSDLCAKDQNVVTDACLAVFGQGLGMTGGVHAFRLAEVPPAAPAVGIADDALALP